MCNSLGVLVDAVSFLFACFSSALRKRTKAKKSNPHAQSTKPSAIQKLLLAHLIMLSQVCIIDTLFV